MTISVSTTSVAPVKISSALCLCAKYSSAY
jgi:hypothetical protein